MRAERKSAAAGRPRETQLLRGNGIRLRPNFSLKRKLDSVPIPARTLRVSFFSTAKVPLCSLMQVPRRLRAAAGFLDLANVYNARERLRSLSLSSFSQCIPLSSSLRFCIFHRPLSRPPPPLRALPPEALFRLLSRGGIERAEKDESKSSCITRCTL